MASWMNSPVVAVGLRVQLVKRPLAFAPRLHQRAVREQAEVRGDARLAEPGDFLQFVDGQFVALQQRHDAQPRRVGQGPQGFQGGGHGFWRANIFSKNQLTRCE